MKRHHSLLAGISLGLLFNSGAAFTQENKSLDDRVIETITVTAQKREQDLQDVPIVITALTGQLIEDAGASDLKELAILTAGVTVTSNITQADTTVRIRGIGTVGNNPGLESSVGVSIDGVPRARNGVAFGDLGEVERIEILKGPQGTLFGKSTSAGVVNVVSKGPEDEFGANLEVSAGNYGFVRTSAGVTGPLSDTTAGRLYVAYENRDGYLDVNTGPGPRTSDEDWSHDFYTIRGQLQIDPTDEISIRLIADYTERNESCCLGDYVVPEPVRTAVITALAGGVGPTESDPFTRLGFANRSSDAEREDWGLSAEVSWELGIGTLTSLTSYRDWIGAGDQDGDFGPADLFFREMETQFSSFETFTQELRLSGSSDNLDWVVGAYYSQEDQVTTDAVTIGDHFFDYINTLFQGALTPFNGVFWTPGSMNRNDIYGQDTETMALFAQGTYALTEQLDATLGVRFTSDEKDLVSNFQTEAGSCLTLLGVVAAGLAPDTGIGCFPFFNDRFDGAVTNQTRKDEEVSGTFKLSYDVNDNIMTYVSYARGYKAGGFNLDRAQTGFDPTSPATILNSFQVATDTSFDPETVDAYEIGWKASNDSSSLVFNGAYFYQEYAGFQLNTFTGDNFVVSSVPEVKSEGVDVDFRFLPQSLPTLSIQGGVTYAETKYGNFDAAAFNLGERLPGNTISYGPRWSTSLSATLETAFAGEWQARWNLAGRYTSSFNTGADLNPLKAVGDLFLLNGRVVFYSDNSPFSLELWGQNLTDKDYYQFVFDAALQTGTLVATISPPRTYGASLKASF